MSQEVYTIKSKNAGRVLDISQDTHNRGMLIIWDSYNAPNQQFILAERGT